MSKKFIKENNQEVKEKDIKAHMNLILKIKIINKNQQLIMIFLHRPQMLGVCKNRITFQESSVIIKVPNEYTIKLRNKCGIKQNFKMIKWLNDFTQFEIGKTNT